MTKNYLFLITISFFLFSGSMNDQSTLLEQDTKNIHRIFNEVLGNGECYQNLEYLCKGIGGRLSGSPQAAAAVEWGRQVLEVMDIDSAYLQPCMVPHWVRGEKEVARIISKHIGWEAANVCALGNSVGTGKWGITAPVVEIQELSDLEKLGKKKVEGKIVFLNKHMDDHDIDTFKSYGHCSGNRYKGTVEAAEYGAVAFMIRSLGHAVDEHPHTGGTGYKDGVPKIPAAAISTLHANRLSGLLTADPDLTFHLNMQCETRPDKPSANVIGEIKGSEYPDEVILVSGHLDSWDNGEGAHDDGAGTVQSMEVLRIFRALDIQPKRTIRCVLWMNEENGTRGAKEYVRVAKEKDEKHLVAIESDRGGFVPRGFSVNADDTTFLNNNLQHLKQWLPHLQPYNIHQFEQGFSGVDIQYLKPLGTLCMGLIPDPQRYFDYHHTPNDTFDKVNKRELELGAGTMAALIYLLSEHGLK